MSFYRNKKVLVTSGSDFIGSHLTMFGVTRRTRFDLTATQDALHTHRRKTTKREAVRIAFSVVLSLWVLLKEWLGRSEA